MTHSLKLTRAHLSAVNWKAVGFFYVLACSLSYGLHFLPNPTEGILPRHTILTYGLGPITAAVVTRFLFKTVPHRITWLGDKPGNTLLFVAIPLLVGTLFGIVNKAGRELHVYGLLVAVSGILYGLVEEAGWRGFLQDALRPLPTFWRVMLIGTMWLGWHFTFLPDLSGVVGPNTPLLGVLDAFLLASWGLGAAAERTKAVLVAACLHEGLNLVASPVALGIVLVSWTLLLICWDRSASVRNSLVR